MRAGLRRTGRRLAGNDFIMTASFVLVFCVGWNLGLLFAFWYAGRLEKTNHIRRMKEMDELDEAIREICGIKRQ